MRNEDKNAKIRYPVQTARTEKEVWNEFNENRQIMELTWNQFIKHLNKLLKRK